MESSNHISPGTKAFAVGASLFLATTVFHVATRSLFSQPWVAATVTAVPTTLVGGALSHRVWELREEEEFTSKYTSATIGGLLDQTFGLNKVERLRGG